MLHYCQQSSALLIKPTRGEMNDSESNALAVNPTEKAGIIFPNFTA